MSDFYTEQLVKRKPSPANTAKKAGLIVITVLAGVFALVTPFAIIALVVMLFADYFLFMMMDVEYEYLFVNGDLDIDVILKKTKRKRKASFNLREQLELLALKEDPEVQRANPEKVYNFSSGDASARCCEMIVRENNKTVKVIFEPNQEILDGIRSIAPRKVRVKA